MTNPNELKETVRQKYEEIALQDIAENKASCCGAGGCSTEVFNIMSDNYVNLEGYAADADLGLGCGLPTQFAKIKKGDTVVDLGSGAGNDCFIARHETGETGRVIGIDFTEAMLTKAKANVVKLGYDNVQFIKGDIEEIPLRENTADVVVSNCVLNLVPNKEKAYQEVFRILKPGGHFSISDVVLTEQLPPQLKEASEMYAGCVAGAILKDEYLGIIEKAGFKNVTLQKEKRIAIPDDILLNYIDKEPLQQYKKQDAGIYSITVYAEKPAACCGPNCCN